MAGLEWANANRVGAIIRLGKKQNKGYTVRVPAVPGELSALAERRWRASRIGQTLTQHVFHAEGLSIGGRFRPVWRKVHREAGLDHPTRLMFDRYNIIPSVVPRHVCKATLPGNADQEPAIAR